MERDWQLLERLSKLDDSVCIGVQEVAAITNFAALTIQQRRIKGFPEPIPGPRRLTWHIGQIRAWGIDAQNSQTSARPTDVPDKREGTKSRRNRSPLLRSVKEKGK